MKNVHIHTGKHLTRRTCLQAAGVSMGLPLLDAMTPAFAASKSEPKAKRFVGMSLSLGLNFENLVPENAGTGYKPSKYLKSLQNIRNKFTVVSGSSHPGVVGGHTAEGSIFSACPNSRGATSRNTISLDQLMAKHLGHETRFPSMVLNVGNTSSPSYTENGAMIQAMNDPMAIFKKLFVNDNANERKRQAKLIKSGRGVMDLVAYEAKRLQKELGAGDKAKLDEWFTSVNELEKRLSAEEEWVHKPKPKVETKSSAKYDKNNVSSYQKSMLDIVSLALQSDSTRFITLHVATNNARGIDGVTEGYHGLSHHGRDEEKLKQLAIIEQLVVNNWANFLRGLDKKDAGGRTLLDETMVLLTSNLGNASSHNNLNMPCLFAGGGFKHGRHLAFDKKKNYPLPNLYLNSLQQLGLPFDKFATSTGTMQGLV